MRVKTVGKRKSNGVTKPAKSSTPTATPESTAKPRSLAQELSERDKEMLVEYLNDSSRPFTVSTIPASRKRKRTGSPLPVQQDLWEDRLSVAYEVKPATQWDSLRHYKRFTVGSESIATGECILVKHDDSDDARIDIAEQWKAKVLEVRAHDTEHVYLRVAWLNRPEDLPTGRKPYHGKNELIPTNQMDVIDAMAVNGRLEVQHWDDTDEESAMMADDTYFWRQTYDWVNTKQYSKLRQICIDSTPQNPDEMIIQCPSAECRKWLHVKCIAEDAVRRASENSEGAEMSEEQNAPHDKVTIPPTSTAQARSEKDGYTAEVFIKDLPDDETGKETGKTEIVVMDAKGRRREAELVRCLFCQTAIE